MICLHWSFLKNLLRFQDVSIQPSTVAFSLQNFSSSSSTFQWLGNIHRAHWQVFFWTFFQACENMKWKVSLVTVGKWDLVFGGDKRDQATMTTFDSNASVLLQNWPPFRLFHICFIPLLWRWCLCCIRATLLHAGHMLFIFGEAVAPRLLPVSSKQAAVTESDTHTQIAYYGALLCENIHVTIHCYRTDLCSISFRLAAHVLIHGFNTECSDSLKLTKYFV